MAASQVSKGHEICFSFKMMKVIDFETYKFKHSRKDITWLYSASYDQLFNEFIEAFNRFELDPQNGEIHAWIDEVTDALNERFYNKKNSSQDQLNR